MLLLGTAKVNITPSHPVPLAGFELRQGQGAHTGVSHSLFARIFCFQHMESEQEATSAVVISADLLWWGNQMIDRLHQKIREHWPADTIILHATHTHSGPQTSDSFSLFLGKHDPVYLEELESRILEGIDAAITQMEPVLIERGSGECGIAMNRRRYEVNQIHTYPEGPVDRELSVIRYTGLHGRVKGILVHYACHPVITAANMVSSEFTGVAMEKLEQSIGDGAVCVYLQGTCGDINPYVGGGGGDETQVVKFGLQLAHDIRRVLAAPMRSVSPVSLGSERVIIELSMQAPPDREDLETLQEEPDVIGEWSRKLLDPLSEVKASIPFEVTTLTLAKGIRLYAMNAEVVVEYGLYLKSISGHQALPLGYSNGMIGYIPTARQLAEGGYEPIGSTYYFGLPAPFDPSIEQMLREEFQQLENRWNNPVKEQGGIT
ncbi:neutral/alkaline non-lysosomal ceramidase N-terminal domain-containing protein [Paenibacillus eucommiae]|uniref:Neutral/alkaline non-lysosomal ceramidase N-terminal domain-containing protein n=1 Tax=Paenibacillus eucommiae TaxID=1355755 RepID=A0ABS4IRM3_9BACL|nr:neutral/alkaline non-lysosomal ceramidase N-terminal domain-containing protein [Paenibacillus eucommiae]MBP1990222.1 hypothetical protein [Paenibacillus eucommiae]